MSASNPARWTPQAVAGIGMAARFPLGGALTGDTDPGHELDTRDVASLLASLQAQQTVQGLAAIARGIVSLERHCLALNASALSAGPVVAAATDALTLRLLQLAVARFGPAPVGVAWAAAGALARREQTAQGHQSNFVILDDAYDAARHERYFRALTGFVCTGLNACGFAYGADHTMAMIAQWRLSLGQWRSRFRRWITQPDPASLASTLAFFDMRPVGGQPGYVDALRAEVLQLAKGHRTFIAHMAALAAKTRPPLGVFGRIVTPRHGLQAGRVDLMRQAIAPIVDVARVHALAAGDAAAETVERLHNAAETGAMPRATVDDLRDALEHLAALRLGHHTRRRDAGRTLDDLISPRDLSAAERSRLKGSFRIIQSIRTALIQRHLGRRSP